MEKRVLLILVGNRHQAAKYVQETLTGWGCLIKTRLGIHQDVLSHCSEHGLIFCELVGDKAKHDELCRKLSLIRGVHAELVSLRVPEDRDQPAAPAAKKPAAARAVKTKKKS